MYGKLKALAVTAAALCGFVSITTWADVLGPGETLYAGQGLASHDGRYTAIMQGDGNFVVYRNSDMFAVWNTGTAGSGANRAVMQTDGNFVVYTGDGRAVFNTGTAWQPGTSLGNEFTVDDQGMAAVIAYAPVWVTNTVTPGGAPAGDSLVFQAGFQFQQGVIYNGPNGNQWTFQADGNLVLYHNGRAVWASNETNNHSGRATYANWLGHLSTWNDAGLVWTGAGNWYFPPNFTHDGMDKPIHMGADSNLLAIQADGNATVWYAARKWGAPTFDPAPPPTPSGPHCIGDPRNNCQGTLDWGPGTVGTIHF